jgi:hypothetical protein
MEARRAFNAVVCLLILEEIEEIEEILEEQRLFIRARILYVNFTSQVKIEGYRFYHIVVKLVKATTYILTAFLPFVAARPFLAGVFFPGNFSAGGAVFFFLMASTMAVSGKTSSPRRVWIFEK